MAPGHRKHWNRSAAESVEYVGKLECVDCFEIVIGCAPAELIQVGFAACGGVASAICVEGT